MSKKNQTRSRFARWILVLVSILLICVYRFVSDSTLWGAWITIAPPALWAVLLFPSAVRARSVLAVASLIVFVAASSEWPRFGKAVPVANARLRVVSWNIGAGNREWAETVRQLNPDVVLVQESQRPLSSIDGLEWFGTVDPGILTRFPVDVIETQKIGPWAEPQLLVMQVFGKRVLVANVRLMLPSPVIQLVHPLSERPRKNYTSRIGQYSNLARLIELRAREHDVDAIVVGGDFNIPGRMHSLAPLRRFLRDAWHAGGRGWGGTAPEFLPFARIDQIWTSPNIHVLEVAVVRLAGSDHRAVVTDLELE